MRSAWSPAGAALGSGRGSLPRTDIEERELLDKVVPAGGPDAAEGMGAGGSGNPQVADCLTAHAVTRGDP